MNAISGISYGVYLNKKIKTNKIQQFKNMTALEVCQQCEHYKICKYGKLSKFEKEKIFENNIECENLYFSINRKATLTTIRDTTTGKETKKSFSGKTKDEAISKALAAKVEIEQNGGIRVITKSNKTMYDLIIEILNEDHKLGKIKDSTYKRKTDSLKKLSQEKFINKPISKVTRTDIINYLESLREYSSSTIKQTYELICMAFGKAKYENIIEDNFMEGYNRVEKPKSSYVSKERIALTLDEQRVFVNYLNSVDYEECRYKYLFLLLLSTGMRIGEALALDYEKDIDLENGTITIRKTLTKDKNGKYIIGDTTKTLNGVRTLYLNNTSKQILENAYKTRIENKQHLLFCSKNKTLYAPNTINSALKRLAIKLNIGVYEEENKKGKIIKNTDVHTHMLRGTFATRCAEAKIAPAVLKKILGHKDISITMKYYVDVDKEFEISEGKNIENYLMNKDIFAIEN